jgi:sulfatase maturation enzyme AslB (radical SAM superfamily)
LASHRIRRLFVTLTASCNLGCSYCYQDAKRDRRMDRETLHRSVDLLLDSEQPEVELFFFGGEPLLEFAMIRDAVEYAESRSAGRSLGYGIITNGTLLRPETAAFLDRHRFFVQLSFDGLPKAQARRGPGTFSVLDRRLEEIRTAHPEMYRERLAVASTLTPETVDGLADSFAYFLDREVATVSINPSFTGTGTWRREGIDDLDREYRGILDLSLAFHERTGEIPYTGFRGEEQFTGSPGRISMCGVMRGETPSVDVDGTVHGCVTFQDSFQSFPGSMLSGQLEPMRLGRLEDPDLAPRLRGYVEQAATARMFQDKQDKFSSYRACRDCDYLAECAVCPMSIGHAPGNRDPDRIPDFLCAFYLTKLAYRDRFRHAVRRRRPEYRPAPGLDFIRRFADGLESAEE